MDRTGNLLTLPVHYRDARYHGIREEVAAVVPPEELYARTGIQSLDFNTLNQLYYAKTRTPDFLEQARQLLFIPDLINYFLTGTVAVEYTDASTSQLLDARRRDWDRALIARLGFPDALFTPLVASGTPLGTLSRLVTDELGIAPLRVIAAPGTTPPAPCLPRRLIPRKIPPTFQAAPGRFWASSSWNPSSRRRRARRTFQTRAASGTPSAFSKISAACGLCRRRAAAGPGREARCPSRTSIA